MLSHCLYIDAMQDCIFWIMDKKLLQQPFPQCINSWYPIFHHTILFFFQDLQEQGAKNRTVKMGSHIMILQQSSFDFSRVPLFWLVPFFSDDAFLALPWQYTCYCSVASESVHFTRLVWCLVATFSGNIVVRTSLYDTLWKVITWNGITGLPRLETYCQNCDLLLILSTWVAFNNW